MDTIIQYIHKRKVRIAITSDTVCQPSTQYVGQLAASYSNNNNLHVWVHLRYRLCTSFNTIIFFAVVCNSTIIRVTGDG